MPKLTPVKPDVLIRIFEEEGFVRDRQKGSHLSMVKEGILRPLVIPMHNEVSVGVIQSCIRTSGISRDRYFELLERFK